MEFGDMRTRIREVYGLDVADITRTSAARMLAMMIPTGRVVLEMKRAGNA